MAVTEQVPPVTAAQAFQHYAALYVKYVQIFRKLEAAYDNMVHPQKRMDVKGVLELVQVCVCVEEGFSARSPRSNMGHRVVHDKNQRTVVCSTASSVVATPPRPA